jgi:hypothetical protein
MVTTYASLFARQSHAGLASINQSQAKRRVLSRTLLPSCATTPSDHIMTNVAVWIDGQSEKLAWEQQTLRSRARRDFDSGSAQHQTLSTEGFSL